MWSPPNLHRSSHVSGGDIPSEAAGRVEGPHALQLSFGDLVINLERYQIRVRDRLLALPYREYALLAYLAGRAGQVVPRRQLLEEGLGRHDPGGLRLVDEHLRHLKSVLEREGQPVIEAVGESGYRFTPGPVSIPVRDVTKN